MRWKKDNCDIFVAYEGRYMVVVSKAGKLKKIHQGLSSEKAMKLIISEIDQRINKY
jgi:hypothetical protein